MLSSGPSTHVYEPLRMLAHIHTKEKNKIVEAESNNLGKAPPTPRLVSLTVSGFQAIDHSSEVQGQHSDYP